MPTGEWSSHYSSKKLLFETGTTTGNHTCSKYREQRITGCPTPADTTTTQLPYPKLKEHHRRVSGWEVAAGRSGDLLRLHLLETTGKPQP